MQSVFCFPGMHLARWDKDQTACLDRVALIILDEGPGSRLDPGHMIKIVPMRDMPERHALHQFLERNTEAIVNLSAAAGQAKQRDL